MSSVTWQGLTRAPLLVHEAMAPRALRSDGYVRFVMTLRALPPTTAVAGAGHEVVRHATIVRHGTSNVKSCRCTSLQPIGNYRVGVGRSLELDASRTVAQGLHR